MNTRPENLHPLEAGWAVRKFCNETHKIDSYKKVNNIII